MTTKVYFYHFRQYISDRIIVGRFIVSTNPNNELIKKYNAEFEDSVECSTDRLLNLRVNTITDEEGFTHDHTVDTFISWLKTEEAIHYLKTGIQSAWN